MDRTVIVSLEGIEAIHVDWRSGGRIAGQSTPPETIREMDLTPRAITAALVGTRSPLDIFALQRGINTYRAEPLLAILPGVALQELWSIVGVAETALLGVSAMVVLTALMGLMATVFASLNERRREMAIFRAMGARPRVILGLLLVEAAVSAAVGAILGLALLYGVLWLARPAIDAAFGLWLPIAAPGPRELLTLAIVIGAAMLVSLVPALRAYRLSIADGMQVRI